MISSAYFTKCTPNIDVMGKRNQFDVEFLWSTAITIQSKDIVFNTGVLQGTLIDKCPPFVLYALISSLFWDKRLYAFLQRGHTHKLRMCTTSS